MGKLISLVAASRMIDGGNNKTFTTPEVVIVNEDLITVIPPNADGGLTTIIENSPKFGTKARINTYQVYQSPEEIEASRNPATTDVLIKQAIQLALAGVGTTIASTLILKYFNEMLTLGVGATDAARLPAWAKNKVVLVVNNDASGDPAKIFPNVVGDNINGQAGGAVYNVASGAAVFFIGTSTNTWTTAVNRGRK